MRRLSRLAKTHTWTSATLAATAVLAAGLAGCGNDTEGGIEGSTCVSTDEAFAVANHVEKHDYEHHNAAYGALILARAVGIARQS